MDEVVAYLEYLREMSRKITCRGTLLNVLFKASKKSPDRYLDWDSPRPTPAFQRYLAGVEQDVTFQDGRRLFLGVGLIAGKLVAEGKSATLAAPLFTIPAYVEAGEEKGTELGFEIDWTEASLNYDLLTALLERRDTVDPEDQDSASTALSPAAAQAISDLESDLERRSRAPGAAQWLLSPDTLEEAMSHLRRTVPAVRDRIAPAGVSFRKEDLGKLVNQRPPLWFNHRFAFMATLPDSLSAHEALSRLCVQIRGNA
jgi:hypothetical protein